MIPYPFSCELNITNKCNLNCYFCSMNSTPSINDFNNYSSENLDIIIQQLKKVHCKYISLSGGEPMVHPNFFSIAQKLNDAGFSVTLTTNGTLINKDSITKIKSSGICWIQISMHSLSPETCKTIMGFNVQQKILNAINLINDTPNIGLTVCIVKNPYNKSEIPDIINYLDARKIAYIFRNELKVGRAKNGHIEITDADALLSLYIQNRDNPVGKIRKFAVLTNGDVVTCSELGIPLGNIFKDNLQDIWMNSPLLGLCKGCGDLPCLATYYHNNPILRKKLNEINDKTSNFS